MFLMNEYEISNFKRVIYHELGHVLGYILSNKFEATSLGPIKSLEIGKDKNCVTASNLLYHSENVVKDKENIKINTSNIDRTIAWFIEVLLGCTFESEYFGYNFNTCFNNSGIRDFENMSVIRGLTYFRWNFDDIDEMQFQLKSIIEQDKLIEKISPLIEKLYNEINSIETNQLLIVGENMEKLILEVNSYISESFYANYLEIISMFKLKFSKNIGF